MFYALFSRNGDSQLFDKVRGHDIKLLRYLSVRYICDLMVENKKVKFGLNVTSSEKVDKAQRYADFTLLSVPYPGCEFFKDYKDRDYTAEGLVFNWNQDFVDAPLTIPESLSKNLNINWREYQSWDLVKQTQNYLKLLIHIINIDDKSGLLVHCISGWDRTPLFVSLLRLSLWADGVIHATLEPAEILYLTIAYDWFLFGHMLPDRLSKGEEHITSEKFSAVKKQRRKNSHFRDTDFTVEDICQLKRKDRGSATSLSSDFSLIQEDLPAAMGSFNYEGVELISAGPQAQAAWRKGRTSSPQNVLWSKYHPLEDKPLYPGVAEAKSSSSSSSNQSENNFMRPGSNPLPVPGSNPLAVPGGRSTGEYARSGSSVSTNYGSWQIVSGCGSINDQERKDRGSATSLSSDFSLIQEDLPAAMGSFNYEGVELISAGPQAQAAWRKGRTSSPQNVLWSKHHPLEDKPLYPGVAEAKSSSSSSSNQSENNFMRPGSNPLPVPGSNPLAVPGGRSTGEYARSGSSVSTNYGSWQIVSGCGSINDRGSLTTEPPLPFSFQDEGANGRMCPPVPERQARLEMVREVFLSAYSATVGLKSSASPSGAITGLLEQFARGVGLRGTNMIV
ncbi:UNVERIFIED_CONTAM: hypothetical protein FKN15_060336 [Acipenser sinensis]